MQSKNKKPQTAAERRHVAMIKLLPCGVCEQVATETTPSEAHEIVQGQWFTTIPLCEGCHRGAFNGIHGQARLWAVKKLDEMKVLNATVRRLLCVPTC